jgi:hypothetical protein
MLIGKPPDIPSSEITSKSDYEEYVNLRRSERRRFLRTAAAAGAAVLGADRLANLAANIIDPRVAAQAGTKLETVKSPLTTTGEQLTSFQDITTYNNFYEFGVDKDQPAKNAGGLPTRPWTVKVEGKVAKTASIAIAASRAGAWSCPGSATRSLSSSSNATRCLRPSMSSSSLTSIAMWRSGQARMQPSSGLTPKGCAWTRP